MKPLRFGLGLAFVGSLAVPGGALPPEEDVLPEPPPAVLETSESAEPPPTTTRGEKQRDPFRPFTLDLRPPEPAEPLTPLQTYELRQLTVAAVLWDRSTPLAMLEDELGMGFIVSPGTLIGRNNGMVTAIEPGRVVVEEKTVDFYGREQVNRVVLELPKEGESRIGGREKR